MAYQLYLGGVPPSASSDTITSIFSRYGPIANAWVARATHHHNFGYVCFEAEDDAQACLRELGSAGLEIQGAHVRVEKGKNYGKPLSESRSGRPARGPRNDERRSRSRSRSRAYEGDRRAQDADRDDRAYSSGYGGDGSYGQGGYSERRRPYASAPPPAYDDRAAPRYGDRCGYNEPRPAYGDRRGVYDDRRAPAYDDRVYHDRRGYEGRGAEYQGQAPRYDDRRPPYDDRRAPAYDDRVYHDRRGYEGRGAEYQGQAPRYDDRRPPYDDRRQPYDDRAPTHDERRAAYPDRRPAYEDRRGPRGMPSPPPPPIPAPSARPARRRSRTPPRGARRDRAPDRGRRGADKGPRQAPASDTSSWPDYSQAASTTNNNSGWGDSQWTRGAEEGVSWSAAKTADSPAASAPEDYVNSGIAGSAPAGRPAADAKSGPEQELPEEELLAYE